MHRWGYCACSAGQGLDAVGWTRKTWLYTTLISSDSLVDVWSGRQARGRQSDKRAREWSSDRRGGKKRKLEGRGREGRRGYPAQIYPEKENIFQEFEGGAARKKYAQKGLEKARTLPFHPVHTNPTVRPPKSHKILDKRNNCGPKTPQNPCKNGRRHALFFKGPPTRSFPSGPVPAGAAWAGIPPPPTPCQTGPWRVRQRRGRRGRRGRGRGSPWWPRGPKIEIFLR